jgi:putative transcriptional regulator
MRAGRRMGRARLAARREGVPVLPPAPRFLLMKNAAALRGSVRSGEGVTPKGIRSSRRMNSLKGHLLIATHELLDPNFVRTVTLMLEHSAEGALGIVLNRPTEATVTDLSDQIFDEPVVWDKPLHIGGPVQGPLMMIHTREDLSDKEVLPGLYHAIDAAKVKDLIQAKAEPSLLVANYAGWGPGQLESEFVVESWLTLPATPEHIFWTGAKDLWDVVVNALSARRLSEFLGLRGVPADPTLN